MVTIVFEAHATTFDNENHVASGHFDSELSPRGISQARQLGERHQNVSLDAVFCSDLQRSYRTAEIAFAGRALPIVKDPRLRECDYGDLSRGAAAEVRVAFGKHVTEPFPNGESFEQAALRMKSFLRDLLRDHDGGRVMIIGHRATQFGLEHWINGVPLTEVVTAPWQWQTGWTYRLPEGFG